MEKLLKLLIISFIVFTFSAKVHAASPLDVLINEIAWMGTANSANDEWMELFNNTNNTIDLSGWTLKSADDKLKITLSGTIFAKGFYLLERTDDSSAPEITADLIYKGALSNSGMDLKLYDNLGNLIDQANYTTGWPAGDNKTKQTMERTNVGWQTSKEPNGTPKNKNSKLQETNSNEISNIQNPEPNTQHLTPNTQNLTYPDGVFINELLPAPEGADETDEWIELYNSNNFDVDLSDWKIMDMEGTITTYILPKNTKISGNGYLVLKRPETKITLNNEGDSLNLIQPDGKVIDSVSYEKALKNQSYNRRASGWQWNVLLTPGTQNIITNNIPKEKTKTLPNSKKSDNKVSVSTAAISQPTNLNPEESESNPWFLFLATGSVIIISAVVVLIIKYGFKGDTNNTNSHTNDTNSRY